MLIHADVLHWPHQAFPVSCPGACGGSRADQPGKHPALSQSESRSGSPAIRANQIRCDCTDFIQFLLARVTGGAVPKCRSHAGRGHLGRLQRRQNASQYGLKVRDGMVTHLRRHLAKSGPKSAATVSKNMSKQEPRHNVMEVSK